MWLYHHQHIKNHFFGSTDADSHLPDNYFSSHPQDPKISVIIYTFKHENLGNDIGHATLLYETALRYYVAGLSWAGSPYAFYSIGSILAFNVKHYCQARGFPKRAAGEDFYLLNKLAKLGSIYHQTEFL